MCPLVVPSASLAISLALGHAARGTYARSMITLCVSTATAALQHAPRTRRDALGLGLAAAAAAPHATPVGAAAAAAGSKYPSSTTLADGLAFPLASFGLQFYDDATAERLTRLALEAGFRSFFAQVHGACMAHAWRMRGACVAHAWREHTMAVACA